MHDSGEPITKCPVCQYNLAGLQENEPCANCGLRKESNRCGRFFPGGIDWRISPGFTH